MFQCILLIFALREIGEAGIPGCLRGVVFVHHNTILPVRAESILQRLSWSDRPIERDEFENQQLWLANSLSRGTPLPKDIGSGPHRMHLSAPGTSLASQSFDRQDQLH